MSDELRLLLAQVDDVSGEVMGEFITQAERIGVRNIQVVPSLTKKNRPGYLVYLDVPAALEDEAAALLGGELGTWGYRVLAAEHRHFDIRHGQVHVRVSSGALEHCFVQRFKRIQTGPGVPRVKAEQSDLSDACAALRELGCSLPLATLKALVESRLLSDEAPAQIAIEL